MRNERLAIEANIKEMSKRIRKANLPKPSILVNSGNGIQILYWLLDKRINNGDISATGKARILKYLDTLNIKDIIKPLAFNVVGVNYDRVYNLSNFKKILREKI